ncbi:MAG: tetratricopeptide repeat protein, partial [Agathobacter sp.]|nr:tetratricopeptide repeat protein [Agathobacter sp.]
TGGCMGELLICNEPIAAMPYYIEGVSWNVYSLEELCYYVENNTYLLEKDFMTEELCTWIGKEVNNLKLADRLRDIMHLDGRLSEFVLALLVDCGYCPKDVIQEIVRIIREMEEKSDFECNKVRADRLMEKEKYLSSIYEYKSLLESNEAGEQSKELLGNIWHNLGTAYARLFLFKEAVSCYEKAYKLNLNEESLKECLMAHRCLKDEMGFEMAVQKYQVPEALLQEVREEVALAGQSEVMSGFESKLEEIVAMNTPAQRAEYHKAISNIIFNWKEEYRRICRM